MATEIYRKFSEANAEKYEAVRDFHKESAIAFLQTVADDRFSRILEETTANGSQYVIERI
jgi:hypothetical protein